MEYIGGLHWKCYSAPIPLYKQLLLFIPSPLLTIADFFFWFSSYWASIPATDTVTTPFLFQTLLCCWLQSHISLGFSPCLLPLLCYILLLSLVTQFEPTQFSLGPPPFSTYSPAFHVFTSISMTLNTIYMLQISKFISHNRNFPLSLEKLFLKSNSNSKCVKSHTFYFSLPQ